MLLRARAACRRRTLGRTLATKADRRTARLAAASASQ